MENDHGKYMAMAIAEARAGAAMGEQPFGAIVVLDGEVVVRSRSLKVSTSDTTAHSETLAIKMATQKLGQREIPDAIFYSTCEPCPMCLGAILNAGIKTLVLGARNADLRQLAPKAFNFKDFSAESFAKMVGWDLNVVTDVMHEECVGLYGSAAVPLTR